MEKIIIFLDEYYVIICAASLLAIWYHREDKRNKNPKRILFILILGLVVNFSGFYIEKKLSDQKISLANEEKKIIQKQLNSANNQIEQLYEADYNLRNSQFAIVLSYNLKGKQWLMDYYKKSFDEKLPRIQLALVEDYFDSTYLYVTSTTKSPLHFREPTTEYHIQTTEDHLAIYIKVLKGYVMNYHNYNYKDISGKKLVIEVQVQFPIITKPVITHLEWKIGRAGKVLNFHHHINKIIFRDSIPKLFVNTYGMELNKGIIDTAYIMSVYADL